MKLMILLLVASLSIIRVSASAQTATNHHPSTSTMKSEKMKYSCPMHPEVTGHKHDKCSKCGMELTKTKKVKMDKYACPMHADVTGKKHDKCSKCGMEMTKSKKGNMKMDHSMSYSCPMHSDQMSAMPGKCSKCGMDMKQMKHK